jgi:hypothetical protein
MAINYAMTDDFRKNFGIFYSLWLILEATIECAIGRFLDLPHRKTHILMAGMEFGRKASLLRILLDDSDHPDREKIRNLLVKIQNEAKRNIFTHSLLKSEVDNVTFVHRKVQNGKFTVTSTKFSPDEFNKHVVDIIAVSNEFGLLLGINQEEFEAYCQAAINAS